MQIKTFPKCGANWINNQLYWATGKEGKEENLAGLVCNTIDNPNCINAKKGDYRWNTDFSVRKLYETLTEAQEDLYSFGGEISAEVIGE